jgi:hypothetical protein
MRTTTLSKIRSFNPCKKGWKQLLRGLGKTREDDKILPYSTILGICDLSAAIWTTRTEDDLCWGKDLAIAYTQHASCLVKNSDLISVLNSTERFVRGETSREEMYEICEKVTGNPDLVIYTEEEPYFDDGISYEIPDTACANIEISKDLDNISIFSAGCVAYDHALSSCKDFDYNNDEVWMPLYNAAYVVERKWQEQEFLVAVS